MCERTDTNGELIRKYTTAVVASKREVECKGAERGALTQSKRQDDEHRCQAARQCNTCVTGLQ